MTADRNPTAREYLRVSVDKSGRERSIDEQHQDNARFADEHGWHVGDAYRDVGSASRYARNGRGGYDTLVQDLQQGRFGADVLVLWESSRGSRRVGERVTLIELAEEHQVRIAVTTHARIYDPSNPRDRRSLLEDAVDSEYESGKLRDRAKRAAAANATEGRPHGRVPYGYRRRYDERTRKLIAQEPAPTEAPIVRELFDRLQRGHSLRSIAVDFDARGVRTRSGKTWSTQHLRSIVTKRLYIGERVHKGQVTKAEAWPAIVDRTTWLAVQRILTAPDRKTARPGRAVHLLSMIARCDVCSGPICARNIRGNHRYMCRDRGCVWVDYDDLTELAEATMLAYLSRKDNVARLTAETTGQELDAVRLSIGEIRAELEDLADQVGRGELSSTLAARAEPAILARLKAAEERETELSTPSRLRGLIKPGKDVRRRWKAAPMSARREVARILLSPEILGELRVARARRAGRDRVPAHERVVWRQS
jgi:DNA invertase Pin-like site-specific DNA recombinase